MGILLSRIVPSSRSIGILCCCCCLLLLGYVFNDSSPPPRSTHEFFSPADNKTAHPRPSVSSLPRENSTGLLAQYCGSRNDWTFAKRSSPTRFRRRFVHRGTSNIFIYKGSRSSAAGGSLRQPKIKTRLEKYCCCDLRLS